MYGHANFTAFTGFAVVADAAGLFRHLGVAGPLLAVLHVLVGLLLVLWVVSFALAIASITLRRLAAPPAPVLRRTVLAPAAAPTREATA